MPINYDSIFPGKQQSAPPSTGGTSAATGGAPASPNASPGQNGQGQSRGGLPYVPEVVSNLGAGIGQGLIRDPEMTLDLAGNWLAHKLGYGEDPQVHAAQAQTAAQTDQYNQQYGGSTAAWLGRLGGNVAAGAAIPGGAEVEAAANALNLGRWIATALRGAYAGGTSSALTAGGYGENPLTAGAEGALGGGLLGGATAAVTRPVASALTSIADRLGVRLSAGQQNAGGLVTRLEDLSGPLPGSGAAKFSGQQQGDIAKVLQRNMGVPETGEIDLPQVQQARQAAGQDMGRIAGSMNIDGAAAAGAPLAPGAAAPTLTQRLDQIVTDAEMFGPDTQQAHAARAMRDQITAALNNNGGVMPGSLFQRFIGYGNALDKMADHSNPEVQGVASDVRNALMTAANNTSSNPSGVLDAFRAAQLRYKASVLANTVTTQTGDFATVTPAALKQAIYRQYADQMTAGNTGAGYDIPDLARLIRGIPKLASSGTAERAMLYNLALGGGAGALGYLATPTALAAGIHAAIPAAALIAAGRASRFGPGMGVPYVGNALQAALNYANPLLPRLAGQGVGQAVTGNYSWPKP